MLCGIQRNKLSGRIKSISWHHESVASHLSSSEDKTKEAEKYSLTVKTQKTLYAL
jgi:hypothetical protein